MDGIEAKGRRFTAPVVKVSINASGVVLRVDDAKNSELWFELFIDPVAFNSIVTQFDDAVQDAEDADRADD